ncbi:uncharacterized protein LOC104902589 isoform X2 [Beta vulgaris subsp. vulgaris]|uniref:uncharacterized protein LOC104902589 isoform X2 n=1 Tax=Beta vulgaris subsp. vulgaris TaxID=3555 RepID=UPI0020374A6C|nr:uncharacterized protein LOC104902589 isoform X2 [Beta vulgaris subsp. vulgaris]
MSFGKKLHGRAPPPLPMYERVVLKHVPTMVRRRYDADLEKLIQGLSSEDSKSDGDHGAQDANPAAISDEDDCVNDEAEDQMYTNSDPDTQTCTEDFGSNDLGSSMSTYLKSSSSQRGGAEDVSLADSIEFHVEDKIEDDGHAKYDNDDQEDCKDKDDGFMDTINLAHHVDDSVKNEILDNEQGILVEDSKSDMGGTDEAKLATFVDANEDTLDDDAHAIYDNDQGCEDKDGEAIVTKNLATHVDAHTKTEIQDNEQGTYVEDNKSEVGGAVEGIMDSNFEDKVEDDGQANFDKSQGFCSKDCEGEDEDDGAIDANSLANYVDASVENEVESNEHFFHVEHIKREAQGAKDANVACYYVDDTSLQDEVHDQGYGESDIKQGFHVEKCKDSEGDGAKDANFAKYYVVNNVKDDVLNKEDGKFDCVQGLQLEDGKSEDKGGEDENVANFCDVKDNEQDFNPEAFKKTLEEDGYDLCCPNCKHYITNTMIFQRREDCQHYQTTCFTCFIDLFHCIRW